MQQETDFLDDLLTEVNNLRRELDKPNDTLVLIQQRICDRRNQVDAAFFRPCWNTAE